METKDKEEEKEEEEKNAPTEKLIYEWEQKIMRKAIWLRAKEDVTGEEFILFMKILSGRMSDFVFYICKFEIYLSCYFVL